MSDDDWRHFIAGWQCHAGGWLDEHQRGWSDEAIAALRSGGYDAYLQTIWWGLVRMLATDRAHHRCEICNVSPGHLFDRTLQIHHVTYLHLGAERADEVIALCDWCHADVHGASPTLWRQAALIARRHYLPPDEYDDWAVEAYGSARLLNRHGEPAET